MFFIFIFFILFLLFVPVDTFNCTVRRFFLHCPTAPLCAVFPVVDLSRKIMITVITDRNGILIELPINRKKSGGTRGDVRFEVLGRLQCKNDQNANKIRPEMSARD